MATPETSHFVSIFVCFSLLLANISPSSERKLHKEKARRILLPPAKHSPRCTLTFIVVLLFAPLLFARHITQTSYALGTNFSLTLFRRKKKHLGIKKPFVSGLPVSVSQRKAEIRRTTAGERFF